MIHLLSSDRRKWKEEIKDYSDNSMNTFIYVNSLSFSLRAWSRIESKCVRVWCTRVCYDFIWELLLLISTFRKVFQEEDVQPFLCYIACCQRHLLFSWVGYVRRIIVLTNKLHGASTFLLVFVFLFHTPARTVRSALHHCHWFGMPHPGTCLSWHSATHFQVRECLLSEERQFLANLKDFFPLHRTQGPMKGSEWLKGDFTFLMGGCRVIILLI